MKGISDIIVLVLLLIISVSLIGLAYVWSVGAVFDPYPEERTGEQYLKSRSCLSMENIDVEGGTASLRNCGKTALSTFAVYVDNIENTTSSSNLNSGLAEGTLYPGESYPIEFQEFSSGTHTYYVTADYTQTVAYTLSS
jgi:hypothetical protein